MSGVWWSDLCEYSLEIAFLVGIAACVPGLLRMRLPGARLVYWQALLAACLLLPLVRPWRQEIIVGNVTVSSVITGLRPGAAAHQPFPWMAAALALLAAGAVVRLGWLGVGFWKLRRYRRCATPLDPAPAWSVEAALLVSEDVTGPVTFGFRRPVVLLPARFPELNAAMQEAILCHEILHVRRRDWLFVLGEELVRAVFWFHPAIWWVLGEIQLAREQAVDRGVIEMTAAREPYLDALLAMAGAHPALDLAPAPLFLRKRHLKQRVMGIVKEVRMSKLRSMSLLAAGLTVMGVTCWIAAGAFPLAAAPQMVADAAGVSVETGGVELMHRTAVPYPKEAMAKGVEGTVVVQVKVDAAGEVADATVLSGPEELRRAVLQSVLNWHFAQASAGTSPQIAVSFAVSKDAMAAPATEAAPATAAARAEAAAGSRWFTGGAPMPTTIEEIRVVGLSDAAKQELLARLPVKVGDTIDMSRWVNIPAVAAFDPHLTVRAGQPPSGNVILIIEPRPVPPSRIRVGANVQSANLISKIAPKYPAEAKQERLEGAVELTVTIGPDGKVSDLTLLSGPPVLAEAAMDAVKQWVYRPTLLNGEPVTVVTNVTVNFTLAK